MAILPIRLYPDPVLRVRCEALRVFDQELERLARDMVETMHAAPGVGLAAPQVGVSARLAVVDLSVGEQPEGLLVLANPEILEAEGEETEVEGCLSIPSISEKIARPSRIRVHAQALDGGSFELTAEGLLARAILHERDHLDGVLFIDRLRGLRRDRVKRQLRRLQEEAALEPAPAH